MRVTLVPSSIALDGEEPSQYLITYLLNDTVAIDAGSLGLYGSPRRQAEIKHVLISHTHIDHTATLPIFIENAYEAHAECVTIHGSDHVLDSLRKDMFNGRTWPDFVALSEGDVRLLRLERLEPGEPVEIDGLKITPIPVNHVVPTLGFLIEDDHSTVVIASDTAPTDLLWRRANEAPRLDAVFLEAAFPNAMASLANISKHLTPDLFGHEIGKLNRPTTVVAVHIKARFRDQIVAELEALGLPRLQIGAFGKAYQW
jgi:ribonuclease BN (tRNA processing enzyme)